LGCQKGRDFGTFKEDEKRNRKGRKAEGGRMAQSKKGALGLNAAALGGQGAGGKMGGRKIDLNLLLANHRKYF